MSSRERDPEVESLIREYERRDRERIREERAKVRKSERAKRLVLKDEMQCTQERKVVVLEGRGLDAPDTIEGLVDILKQHGWVPVSPQRAKGGVHSLALTKE